MGMDTLSHLVLDNFKSWSCVTPYFNKLLRAKRPSILIKNGDIFREGWEKSLSVDRIQNAQHRSFSGQPKAAPEEPVMISMEYSDDFR